MNAIEMIHALHRLERNAGIECFHDRIELFEISLKDNHEKSGFQWRGMGRYGNITRYEPVFKTVNYCFENGWKKEWLLELSEWYEEQGKSYCSPDNSCLSILIRSQIKE